MEELVGDAKRKVRGSLRGWKVGDGMPKDLIAWKDVSPLPLITFLLILILTIPRA